MRNYEMIFIVRPDVADDEVQKLIRDKFARLSSTNVNISGPKVKNIQNLTTQ